MNLLAQTTQQIKVFLYWPLELEPDQIFLKCPSSSFEPQAKKVLFCPSIPLQHSNQNRSPFDIWQDLFL